MILKTFTEADIEGSAQTLVTESNGKGLYCGVFSLDLVVTTPAPEVGAYAVVVFDWTDESGAVLYAYAFLPHFEYGYSYEVEFSWNLAAATDFTARIIAGAADTGDWQLNLRSYISRQNSLGND